MRNHIIGQHIEEKKGRWNKQLLINIAYSCIPLSTGWECSLAQEAIHTEFTLNPRMQLAILPILITAIHSLSIRVTGKLLLTTQTPTWRNTLPHTHSAGAGEIQINTLSQLIKAHNRHTKHYLNQTLKKKWENVLLIRIHLNRSALLPRLFCA